MTSPGAQGTAFDPSRLPKPAPDELAGRVAIVTGAGRGMGRAAAERLSAAGASVVVNDLSTEAARAAAAALRDTGGKAIAIGGDVTSASDVSAMVERAVSEFGSVHVLINNAGYHERGHVETVAAEDLGRMIDVNLKAPIMLCRLAIPYMRNAVGGAAIINVASLAGRVPVRGAALIQRASLVCAHLRSRWPKNCAIRISSWQSCRRGPSIPASSWRISMRWKTLRFRNR